MARRRKKSSVGKRIRTGHGKLTKAGTYKRSDTRKYARYDIIRDLKKKAKHLPEEGKPFTGDEKKVYYRITKTKDGRLKVEISKKPRKGWKIGYL